MTLLQAIEAASQCASRPAKAVLLAALAELRTGNELLDVRLHPVRRPGRTRIAAHCPRCGEICPGTRAALVHCKGGAR